MISVSPARRRAEEFAALVDGLSGAGDSRFSELLELVGELRDLPAATPRAEFVSDLRSQLMAAADEALSPLDSRLALRGPAAPATTRRRDRRLAVAAGAIVAIGATSSVAVAAQSALPGDALYPIKRVLESARTSVEADDSARAEHILASASDRLEEAEALALRDSAESKAAMPDTLHDFVTQANQAADLLISEYDQSGDVDHILELRGFTADSLDLLAALKPELPADLSDELQAAVDALLAIDARALDACPDCGGLLELPLALVSGGAVSDPAIGPSIAPRTTLEAPSTSPRTSSDPVEALIANLPLLGPTVAPKLPPVGLDSDPGTSGDDTEVPPADPVAPLEDVTDPVLGDDGLLTGDNALANLLAPVVDPLTGGSGLLD
jgi:hypothetical protein